MLSKTFSVLSLLLIVSTSYAFEKFIPAQGGQTEVWKITDDPTVRDWANYHNTDAWSPDGRYVCWLQYAWLTNPVYPTDLGNSSKVYVFDLTTKQIVFEVAGSQPRWASKHNWFFFMKDGKDVMWLDVDSGKLQKLCDGVLDIGETDADDKWLFGTTKIRKRKGPKGSIVRVPITQNSTPELLGEAYGVFQIPNPQHSALLLRVDGLLPRNKKKPFTAIHVMTDLEGENMQVLSPELRHCHQTWSGDGKWFMMGNGQMRGRLWNEPFPSNSHYLAAITCGDISPCGRSGRWVVGGNNIGPAQIADLRSGWGRNYLYPLSFMHYFGSSHTNSTGDIDSKGSPDGTKIVFVTNYDLKDAPFTKIAEDMLSADADQIIVESTDGFPESGRLSIQSEIVGYKRKTPTSFEGLTREMYGVRAENPGTLSYLPPALFKHYTENRLHLLKGLIVTSFDKRLLSDGQRAKMTMPDSKSLPENWKEHPSVWQRRNDVHVAVVRKPDSPFLINAPIEAEEDLQLVPGENHWETQGYCIYKDGKRLNNELLKPGDTLHLGGHADGKAHLYIQAVAVEYSGLQSEKSITLHAIGNPTLKVLEEKPASFSWTYDRWVVGNVEVSYNRAINADEYVKEIIHLYEGPIAKEWYSAGQLTKRYDLNLNGFANRRLYYANGKLARRDYFNDADQKMSEEYFGEDGYIYESKTWARDFYLNGMTQATPYLESHWFYDNGMPTKLIGSDSFGHHTCFPGVYKKNGNNWIRLKELVPQQVDIE